MIDDFLGGVGDVVEGARALGPYPADAASYYPGVRREIGAADVAANAYVTDAMNRVAPFVAGAFDCERFDLVSASFSIVSTPPFLLLPMQRAPHFDSPDPDYIAVLHYLSVPPGSGTAFFRQRSTGIERVDDGNIDRFICVAHQEGGELRPEDGYIQGSDDRFEELYRVGGVADRLVFYQGGLLHSGIIPPDMPLDPDPQRGRLTANFFIQLNRE